jgi:hypothetical protein
MTSDQETRVLAMLSAFEAGKKISELDTASGSVSDMRIEVLDTDGESKVMNLSEAVTKFLNLVVTSFRMTVPGASWIPRTTTVSRTVHRRSWTARWDSICGVGILVFILPSGKWVI